jgi:hypothetical protein
MGDLNDFEQNLAELQAMRGRIAHLRAKLRLIKERSPSSAFTTEDEEAHSETGVMLESDRDAA